MVKSYLRYEPGLAFGVIASLDGNITYDPSGLHLLAPALDKIILWNLKQGLASKTFSASVRSTHTLGVTSIAASSSSSTSIASGHADGSIRLWDCEKATCEATLNGHKSAVTALRYNHLNSVLASGGKDCDVILWDVVGEAGLFRLRGHRDQVTDLVFLDSGKKLVTSSKDKFMRVWDLELQQCIQIVSGHHSEIWSLDVDPKERFLVSGSADAELRFYQIRNNAEDIEKESKWGILKQFGEIQRQSKDRVGTLRFNKSGSLLACQVAGKLVEIYRVLDDVEARRKAKRRLHRKEKKVSTKAMVGENENGVLPDSLSNHELQHPTVVVSDVFKLLQTLRASKKICSIAFCPSDPKVGLATLSLSLNNNMLETHLVDTDKISKLYSIELHGHRSDIRSVTLSSDNDLLMSTSHNAVKIWNPTTGACLRTIESGYGLCSSFVPGNRYALVGTKSGTLEIIDVGSGSSTEVIEAHTGSIRSIVPIPDENGGVSGHGFVTGSADHDVKFWEYQLLQKPDSDSKQLTVTNVRTLKMNDDVLAVAISPNSKHLAVSLLDCTIKVFFVDSLKYFLSLYGHKLPVLCMDISSDGDLLVSGSADKNLKIWGLDFGDCHKSIFAHADSVMDVKFVRNTHYMFSVGKDRLVKYWDADKFELLLTLEGHHAEVWCLAVSSRGDFVVTGSHDRSIRRWDRTDEPFFIEEEREKRLEEIFESDLDNLNEDRYAPKELVPDEGSVGVPGKKTKETLSATDLIIDALDMADAEIKRIDEHKEDQKNGKGGEFQPNIMMRGLSPSDYVLKTLANVNTNDLEQTLLSLPFSDALKLMSYLKEWILIPDKVELVCRVTTVLLQTHHNQLTTAVAARPILTVLKDILHQRVKECKDIIGFNLAAMDHLKELMSMRSDAPFRDAKAKLMEVREWQSKRMERGNTNERRKRKKQKPSIESHAGA
ncbi:WD repeat-containing protein 3 isoform X1 [Canna indica]|uniref:WD repeat-containing protein 3 isoform X1 n=1 Tax=Canna indica TaxID=4628 RepID=A0AAQ3KJW3_9LILI|nr:WD repeat-containing protein 3 isoform X1 [Canna indica]